MMMFGVRVVMEPARIFVSNVDTQIAHLVVVVLLCGMTLCKNGLNVTDAMDGVMNATAFAQRVVEKGESHSKTPSGLAGMFLEE